jgi:peroxiredoxin
MIARHSLLLAFVLFGGACKPATGADGEPDEGELRAGAAGAHEVGLPAPALQLTTLDGKTLDLAKLYGTKPVYLKFWATWCVPCREQMPKFEHIYETLGDRIEVIAVDAGLSDDVASVHAFRDEHGMRMPIVIDDGSLAAALDLQVTPQHVLIGRDGRIAYVGHQDGAKLDQALQRVLAQPAPNSVVSSRTVDLPRPFGPGDQVRDLRATLIDGSVVELGATRDGRPRGLVLFADWCESYLEDSKPQTSQACRRVREDVERLIARGDVEWLGIATGIWSSAESVARYKAKMNVKLPLALDANGALFRAFGVHDIPTVVLLDPTGRVERIIGPNDDIAIASRGTR